MENINEGLRKIKEMEEYVTRMVNEENEKSQRAIEDAKKKADEIISNAMKELENLKNAMLEEYRKNIEKTINEIRNEWNIKMEKLKKITLDDDSLLAIAKSILEGEDGAKAR